jgi:hypothetical protein
MLIALGYLEPDAIDPGVAYVVRDGDPRADLLAVVDGIAPIDLDAITGAMKLIATAIRGREPHADRKSG